jgi:hypothetical protein
MQASLKHPLILVFILLCIFFSSCVEDYAPKTYKYDDLLFIEAFLNNDMDDSPYVLITTSMPLSSADSIEVVHSYRNERFFFLNDPKKGNKTFYYGNEIISPQSNAEVSVLCEDGTKWLFHEAVKGSGVYLENTGAFHGEAGKSYKLEVGLNNNLYETGFEELRESPPIDSVSFKVESEKTDEFGTMAEGYQVYVSTSCPDDENHYFRWKSEETFRYESQFRSTHVSRGGRSLTPYDSYEISVCYRKNILQEKHIESTEKYNTRELNNIPLNFVSQYGVRLMSKYYVDVRQYSISKPVYDFWQDLNLNRYGTGGFYSIQPFPIRGNIKCTTDRNAKVIGVFEVAGVSNSISSVSYPHEFKLIYDRCILDTIVGDGWDNIVEGDYIIREEFDRVSINLTTGGGCFDCRFKGGTTEIPDIFNK